MGEVGDPFSAFVAQSTVLGEFAQWAEEQRIKDGEEIDGDFNRAVVLGEVCPEAEDCRLEKTLVAYPDGFLIWVEGEGTREELALFLQKCGCKMEAELVDFDHLDTKNDLRVKGKCNFRCWRKDGLIVATDYRYDASFGNDEEGWRQSGYLLVRVANRILGTSNLAATNVFR